MLLLEVTWKNLYVDYTEIPITSETTSNTDLPEALRHIRTSVRNVRPEFYVLIDKLKSKHHLTTPQAFAAAVEVANKLFGCNWKHHSSAEVIDSDTAPHIKNSREAGKAITVLALSSKVDEMMESGKNLNIF